MSLEARRAAFNTTMDAAMAAWADLCDGLAVNEKVILLPCLRECAGVAATTMDNTDGTSPGFPTDPKLQDRIIFEARKATDIANVSYFLPGVELTGWPLFFKVTNDAGELTV